MSRRITGWIGGTSALALAVFLIGAASASAKAQVCAGSPSSPGVLSGDYPGDVAIEGFCVVNSGPANIAGSLTLRPGSALDAQFALNANNGEPNSRLTVRRNLFVRAGAVLFMGCAPPESPCQDDPSPEHATLSSRATVGSSMIETEPLGVIVHNSTIGGRVSQVGGGGGFTCDPTGLFAGFGSPAFSTYEDSTIGGSLRISGMNSCWLGVARVRIGGNASFIGNQMKDPDAIEIIDNHVGGDLVCRENSMVWDSSETGPSVFPRHPSPNTVAGARVGQCVLASPTTDGSPPGPGPF